MGKRIFRSDQRDADFVANCREIINLHPEMGLSDVVITALERKPQCFYIDYDRASEYIHQMLEDDAIKVYRNYNKQAMLEELFMHTKVIVKRYNWPVDKAITYVLNNARPSRFFISYERGMRIARKYFMTALIEAA